MYKYFCSGTIMESICKDWTITGAEWIWVKWGMEYVTVEYDGLAQNIMVGKLTSLSFNSL